MKKNATVLGGLLAVLALVALVGGLSRADETTRGQDNDKPHAIELKAQQTSPQTAKKLSAQARINQTKTVFVGIGGECHVDSRVGVSIDVYINGRYRGRIPPFGDIYPIVGDFAGEVTTLYAVSADGRSTWGPSRVSGAVGNYVWVLRP